jgi:hypothetical protein
MPSIQPDKRAFPELENITRPYTKRMSSTDRTRSRIGWPCVELAARTVRNRELSGLGGCSGTGWRGDRCQAIPDYRGAAGNPDGDPDSSGRSPIEWIRKVAMAVPAHDAGWI